MINGAFFLDPATNDFRLKRRDSGVEFSDRKGIQVLSRKLGKRITRLFREILVQVHGMER